MTFWRNILPNILLQGQNAVLVVKKTPQTSISECPPYFVKKGDTIQGRTLYKGGHYLRKYGIYLCIFICLLENSSNVKIFNEEDVINIFPVVKHINPRATDAYNFYTTGQSKIQQGYLKASL